MRRSFVNFCIESGTSDYRAIKSVLNVYERWGMMDRFLQRGVVAVVVFVIFVFVVGLCIHERL